MTGCKDVFYENNELRVAFQDISKLVIQMEKNHRLNNLIPNQKSATDPLKAKVDQFVKDFNIGEPLQKKPVKVSMIKGNR